jgi:hypothetical protein
VVEKGEKSCELCLCDKRQGKIWDSLDEFSLLNNFILMGDDLQ